ncbi:Protein F10C2.7, partial [Aphelenchoides avenae]
MIVCNCISVGSVGVVFVLIGVLPDTTPRWILTMFVLSPYFLFAPAGGAFYKCGSLCSRQYAHFVIGNMQVCKAVVMVVAPAMVSAFVSDPTSQSQWSYVYIIMGALCVLANALFCWVATDEPQGFTRTSSENASASENGRTLTA